MTSGVNCKHVIKNLLLNLNVFKNENYTHIHKEQRKREIGTHTFTLIHTTYTNTLEALRKLVDTN